MKQMIDKLASLERDISSEEGEFSLFALFLREDAEDKWDLLASAPWLEADKKESLKYLARQVRSRLDTHELLSLSRIVLLEKGKPVLEAIHKAIRVKHGMAEMRDRIFSGLPIKRAYLITSERESSTGDPTPQPT